jgi:hypothetical protein
MGFVGALGEYESVAAAHRQARAAILLEGLGSCELSQMQVRRGVDADELVLAALP